MIQIIYTGIASEKKLKEKNRYELEEKIIKYLTDAVRPGGSTLYIGTLTQYKNPNLPEGKVMFNLLIEVDAYENAGLPGVSKNAKNANDE